MNMELIYNKFEQLKSNAIDFIPMLLLSIFILIIFYIIAEYFKKYITNLNKNYSQEHISVNTIYYQLGIISYYSILIMGIIFALVNLGFNVATIITILGTVGLALGLAFQDTFKNIIASICISLNNLYNIGDIIVLRMLGNQNPVTGTVIDFDLYTTKIIESKTNIETIIPNNTINNNIVSNLSRSPDYQGT